MTRPALPPDRQAMTAIIATCERWVAEKETELARRQYDLAQLTEQVRELDADLQQARILIAYLRAKVLEA